MQNGARIFSAVFGMLLLAVGLYVLAWSEAPAPWRYIGAAVLVAVGWNAVYAAYQNKPSWLSRLGPLA